MTRYMIEGLHIAQLGQAATLLGHCGVVTPLGTRPALEIDTAVPLVELETELERGGVSSIDVTEVRD